MVSTGIRTSCRATSLRITSCWPTNHSHGCFGQKLNVERWVNICVCQNHSLLFQVPWIVKTDDDMINNIWKLGALVEALKFQRWQEIKGFGVQFKCYHKLFPGTQSLAPPKRNGWLGLKVAEGLINGWGLYSGIKWRLEEISKVIPFDEWPDEFFPTNCWGVVYIMSQFVRNKLIQVKIWKYQLHWTLRSFLPGNGFLPVVSPKTKRPHQTITQTDQIYKSKLSGPWMQSFDITIGQNSQKVENWKKLKKKYYIYFFS